MVEVGGQASAKYTKCRTSARNVALLCTVRVRLSAARILPRLVFQGAGSKGNKCRRSGGQVMSAGAV